MNSGGGVNTVRYCYELFGIRFLLPRPVQYLLEIDMTPETYLFTINVNKNLVLPSTLVLHEKEIGIEILCPHFGSVLIEDKIIAIHTACELSELELFVALAECIIPLLCAVRGSILIHAGAVALDGKGICFLGASGSGKSTSVALAAKEGAAVLSQDVTVLTYDEMLRQIYIEPGGGFVELRSPSLSLIEGQFGNGTLYKDKTLFFLPAGKRVILSDLYFLASPDYELRLAPPYKIFDLLLGSMLVARYTAQKFPRLLLKITEAIAQKVAVYETPLFARTTEIDRGIV